MSDERSVDPNEIHPVQGRSRYERGGCQVRAAVTLRAYEVYRELYGSQFALIDLAGRGCRGGFGSGELVALLYARSFPKAEWRVRVDEALKDMKL